jgi:lysozyme
MTTLEGIDCSSYQGYVNWGEVKTAGKSFGFVKATEGLSFEDPTFPHNWNGLYYHGLHRGAYHFFHPDKSPNEQVDYLHGYVRRNGHFVAGDFVVLDVEIANGISAPTIIERVEAFVTLAQRQIAKTVILYTYPDFWLHALGDPVSPVLAKCPLWLADYGPSVPHLAQWPEGLAFWQYSESGHCPGVLGHVDLNRFYGDRRALHRLSIP